MTNITLNFLDAAVVALDNAVEALASTAGGRRGDYDTDEEAPAEYAALWVAHGAAHAALSAWKAANED